MSEAASRFLSLSRWGAAAPQSHLRGRRGPVTGPRCPTAKEAKGGSVGTGAVRLPGPCCQRLGPASVRSPGSAAFAPSPQVPEPREEGSTHLAVPAVCFTCPLTGATLRKDQRDAHIREAILSVSGSPPGSPLHRPPT